MNEITAPLSDEEFALLEIHSQGGNVADLGEHSKWHVPINALVERGFLKRHDQFNHTITDAGRIALGGREKEEDHALGRMIETASKLQQAQNQILVIVHQIAAALVQIGRLSQQANGGDPAVSVRIWSNIAAKEAERIIRDGK